MNPYLILGVSMSADDAEIRRAYLEGVREFPPEHAPERFQAISRAYEMIGSEPSRLKYRLFDTERPGESPFEVLEKYCAAVPRPKPLDFEAAKAFLRSCVTK